jgi:hypothetical protein
VNWIQSLVDLLRSFWPFEEVTPWERGVYYVWGRHWRHWPARKELDWSVPCGIWFVPPFFAKLRPAPIVPGVTATPLQQITTRDGKPLSFSAAMTWSITDPVAAYHNVERVLEVCADKLADVDPPRLDGEKRRRLLTDMKKWVNEELGEFGCQAHAIRFTNFIIGDKGVHTVRLLQDRALLVDYNGSE